jgi:uncharacterized protein
MAARVKRIPGSYRWLGLHVTFAFFSLLFALLTPRVALAFEVPRAEGAVTDITRTLSFDDDVLLERRIHEYRVRTGDEIGILIIPSLDSARESVESVALQTFNTWGIGKQGVDNGVLLLIAQAERKTRLETGNGMRQRISDQRAASILEELAPYLRDGRYREGLEATIAAISSSPVPAIAPSPESAPITRPQTPKVHTDRRRHADVVVAILVVTLVATGLALLVFVRGRGRRRYSGDNGSYSTFDTSSHSSFASQSSHSSFSSDGGSSGFSGGSSDGGGASGSF